MALKKPLVLGSTGPEQLQSGDTLDASILAVSTVDLTNGGGSSATIGQAVYSSAAGAFQLAKADASGTSDPIGLVRSTSVSASSSGTVQTGDVLTATTTQWDAVTGQTGGLTTGATYFLSAATAGNLTTTAPSTAGQFRVPIGVALSTTDMLVRIQPRIKL